MIVIKQAVVRGKLIPRTTKRVASNFLWFIVSEAIAKWKNEGLDLNFCKLPLLGKRVFPTSTKEMDNV